MATDQSTRGIVAEPPGTSAIENELPTYRAISTRAIVSLICGVLSLFSVASPYFFLLAVLAVVLGVTADRKIQRHPDMLTGRGLAKAGAAMGFIFGLGIFTITTVQGMLRTRDAEHFAREYAQVLKTKGMGELLWLELPPAQRKTATPEEVLKKFHETKRQEAAMLEMKLGGLRSLKNRLNSSDGQEIHFVKIENEGSEGMTLWAQALYEVHGPQTKEYPEPQYALITFKGIQEEGKRGYGWFEESVTFPYKLGTAAAPTKPVDDGHGHAH